ncbi:MAG: YggS family pyridoxal phosphate-dependent enzyme [Candidatus Sumerlaeia bacterium]
MGRIAENIASVNERIRAAALRAGRDPGAVRLVAVTKHRSMEDTRAVLDTGERLLGENRVDEAVEKFAAFRDADYEPPIEWHFIGHVQSRKAKQLVGETALIHSLDSIKLAEKFQRVCDEADCTVRVLMEVNVSGEASKYGFTPESAMEAAKALKPLDRVECVGLMTMAPYLDDPEDTRPVFGNLRLLRDRLRDAGHDHLHLEHLSMGMTNDFEIAVEEGATLVRVGTALFS